MIQAEYLRFLQTLNTDTVHADVRKLANLVLTNMESLIPLGTSQGQRIRRITTLAQTNWNTLSVDINPITEDVAEQDLFVTKLMSLSVGPFRGFARTELFDLSSRLVLIYGPNGTGKSSFCEALEYGLLGNVAEAENKRFRDQREYLKNAYVNKFSAPNIFGLNVQGEESPLVANEKLYRFCFVEKNRIDNFSRIAAQAPAKQTELISTLFGLESFNEFVHKFTTEIDTRYIDLTGVKSTLLAQKSKALEGSKQQITTASAQLQKLGKEEQVLANQYRDGCNYSQMVIEVNGDGKTLGLIKRIESEIQQPLATKSALTATELEDIGQNIFKGVTDLNAKRQELANASQQVSFKNLYDAVVKVQPTSLDNCPACKTPLNQVAINPFEHAEEELKKLQYLAKQEQAIQQLEQQVNQNFIKLTQIVSDCCIRFTSNVLTQYQVSTNTLANTDWWNSLQKPMHDNTTPWQHLQVQVKQLEETDKEIDQAIQFKAGKQAELNRLRDFVRNITILETRRQTANQTLSASQKIITNFDTENEQLISEAEAEKGTVERNKSITKAYRILITKLSKYKDMLPSQLVADLGDLVVTLYNEFNRNDSQSELLATVKLPLAQNQRLEISFQNNPLQFFDPLHMLSEGHIRCIGLAILLAKNLKENCPFLIFDDPVNAIDDDHRDSIRRTLFEDQYFAQKQIILTCHGEEFFKDIQNLLPAQLAAQSRTLTFLPRLDESHIRVDFDCAPRNYIIAARRHLNRNEVREALSKSRQALESLTKGKVWRYVNQYGDGNLSLKLRSATAPIELRNLAEQLKAKVGKGDFGDPNKNLVFDPINTLLGGNGNSREWRYLNKGTHEENDRAEFDRNTVLGMISALEILDQAL
jgi:DNA sulfur modification protein DndD